MNFNLGRSHIWLRMQMAILFAKKEDSALYSFCSYPRFFQTFSPSVEIDLFSLELSGFWGGNFIAKYSNTEELSVFIALGYKPARTAVARTSTLFA